MTGDAASPGTGQVEGKHPLAPMTYHVTKRTSETEDTVTLQFEPTRGKVVPAFFPGQFNMLYVFGIGEAAISVSGDPSKAGSLVHTIRSAGKITDALVQMAPGETVGVRGPYGKGWPLAGAEKKDVVIIAGGLGLPPLRPLIYSILSQRERYGRVEVIYGARTPKDIVYYDEIQGWRSRGDIRFQVTVDAAGREWYGDVGLVTQRIPDARFDAPRTVAYLCGPEIMMKFSAQALVDRGLSPADIWWSMERNMKCAVGFCGHCQFGPSFVCRDGPVFSYEALRPYIGVREL